jgi:LysM repeat protein
MYRYRVEWGYALLDSDPSPADITNWVELPWDTIYPRIEPGPMAFYSARLQAPSSEVILALRAWKKWGTSYRELDVNLDAVQLRSCAPAPTQQCVHMVVRGDRLFQIAWKYHTTVAELMELNHIANPNVLIVGQRLKVPCLGPEPPQPPKPPEPPKPPRPPAECASYHVVMRGDTLYALAKEFNTTVGALVELNRIANPNLIYVGQKLCVGTR